MNIRFPLRRARNETWVLVACVYTCCCDQGDQVPARAFTADIQLLGAGGSHGSPNRELAAFKSHGRMGETDINSFSPYNRYRGGSLTVANHTYDGIPNKADKLAAASIPNETLTTHCNGFVLAGAHSASMRLINGGRLCVGPWGKEPPRYEVSGSISLSHCSHLATAQKGVLGFRWGQYYINRDAYHEYVQPHDRVETIKLSTLFDEGIDYTCALYMSRDPKTRLAYDFDVNGLTGYIPTYHEGSGDEVCHQRWSLERIFYPFVTELWFCYMQERSSCEEADALENVQGAWFLVMFLAFMLVLSYTVRDLPEFEKPLLWIARCLICCELAIWSCSVLLLTGQDSGVFSVVVIIMTYLGQYAIFLPHRLAQQFLHKSPFNVFYLLVLTCSPCVFVEFASYYSAFPLLVARWPCLLGVMTFSLDAIAYFAKTFCFELPTTGSQPDATTGAYAPMTPRACPQVPVEDELIPIAREETILMSGEDSALPRQT